MTEAVVRKRRPKYLAIHQIRLPLPGILSIFHRISGVGLFLFLPFLLCLFDWSVSSPESFATYKSVVTNPLAKLVLLGLLWAFLHHFCAGIRFLLMDFHQGLELETARFSAKIVFAISILLTIVIGVWLW